MTPERWQQVKKVLGVALSLETGERSTYLNQACAADHELRTEVESLLSSNRPAGTALIDSPLFRVEDRNPRGDRGSQRSGFQIGAYTIVEQIGSGGMGEVYSAARTDGQYQKNVAIKLVRAGLDTAPALERFRNERQILATLDHPNIARLLDGGTTAQGVPYLVMELIDGTPIDEYCDAHSLSITDRLRLFSTACAAVQYAHQRLVIHRDIKPSNILVTADGTAKLLDFGIAKIFDPAALPETTLLRPFTPEFASPEQISGEHITTSTDVYSLGVVLYLLVTGHSPYRVDMRNRSKLARAISDSEPDRPSHVVSTTEEISSKDSSLQLTPESVSQTREGSPGKLRRRLLGDLDHMLLKALRKEPQHRYASVDLFAEDIHRHVEGLPVIARKGTWAYRTVKFARRHKVAIAGALLLAIAVIAGVGATLRESRIAEANRIRAEKRFNDVRQLAKSLMFELHDSIAELPGSTNARHLLVQKSLEYLDHLREDVGGDTSLESELASAYERVGDVQGSPYIANLGDTTAALASYRKALAIRTSLLDLDPANATLKAQLSGDYWKIGGCQDAASDFPGSLVSLNQALALTLSAGAATGDSNARDRLAGDYWAIASVQRKTGDLTGSLENYRKAASIHEAVAATNPKNKSTLLVHSSGDYYGMAKVLAAMGKSAEATEAAGRSIALLRPLVHADPKNSTLTQYLADSLEISANCLEERQLLDQSLKNYREAEEIYEQAMAADAKDALSSRLLAYTDSQIGRVLIKKGDAAAALVTLHKALRIYTDLAVKMPHSYYVSNNFANIFMGLGDAHLALASNNKTATSDRRDQWLEARAWYKKSSDIWLALERQGQLALSEKDEPQLVADEIKRCDSALARFPSSLPLERKDLHGHAPRY